MDEKLEEYRYDSIGVTYELIKAIIKKAPFEVLEEEVEENKNAFQCGISETVSEPIGTKKE